jgi:AbrB family looped-hinge helix DNA binding protein
MTMIATLKLETVNFGTKGQVVIPRRLRKEFEIEEGTKATVISTPDGILLKPITRSYIKSLRGSLKGTKAMETFMAERKRERDL